MCSTDGPGTGRNIGNKSSETKGQRMDTKAIKDIEPGDRTPSGITYISEPAEQPNGAYSIQIRFPSGRRALIDFPNGDSDSEVTL